MSEKQWAWRATSVSSPTCINIAQAPILVLVFHPIDRALDTHSDAVVVDTRLRRWLEPAAATK